jgi:hypothetical protein
VLKTLSLKRLPVLKKPLLPKKHLQPIRIKIAADNKQLKRFQERRTTLKGVSDLEMSFIYGAFKLLSNFFNL